MHEFSLMADLVKKINQVIEEQKANRVTGVTVSLGALSHISAGHFREHFEHAVAGTTIENAQLNIVQETDINNPRAQDIILESVECEE